MKVSAMTELMMPEEPREQAQKQREGLQELLGSVSLGSRSLPIPNADARVMVLAGGLKP